jgi:hypothetical protein
MQRARLMPAVGLDRFDPYDLVDAADRLAAAGFVTLEKTADQLIIRPTEKLKRMIDDATA